MFVFQIVDTIAMYGKTYNLIRWLSLDGKREETWVPACGLNVDPKAYSMPKIPENMPLFENIDYDSPCNTSKEKHVRRQKIAGMNIILFPCGTILSVDELFGSDLDGASIQDEMQKKKSNVLQYGDCQ